MKDSKTVLDHMLAPLVQKYLERLQTRESLIAELIAKLESGSLTGEGRSALRKHAHQLAGSGATYGFPAISEAGFALEDAMDAGLEEKGLLPLAQALLQSCHAVQFLQDSSRKTARKTAISDAIPAWDAAQNDTSGEASRKSVLVIDDDPAVQEAVKRLLACDAAVITAPHVEMGMELTKRHRPDLVLLDIDLPVASGMAYLRAMRQDGQLSHTPVVMLTIYRRGVDVVQAMRAGAVGYIAKPIDAATFQGYVRALLLHAGTTVLIADDDEAINDLLAAKFRSLGVRVLQAKSGGSIRELVASHKPQLIVVDWKVTGLDPPAPEKSLREMCGTDTPHCVVLAGPRASQDEVEAAWPGADAYVSKPFAPAEVVTRCLNQLGLPGYEPIPSTRHTAPR